MMLGGLFGVVIGGVCVTVAWWGSIFVVSGVSAVLCLALAVVATPETRDPEHSNLDPVGALLSIVGIGALVLGITEGPVRGWTDPLTAGALALGPVVLGAFAVWELRNPRPMLDLRLFRDRSFSCGTAAVFLAFLASYGWFFMVIQYEAFVLGYDALDIGFSMVAPCVLLIPLAVLGPGLAARHGRRAALALGLGGMAAGAAVMAALAGDGYWTLVPPFAVFLGGLGLLGGPATEAIVESLPPARQGIASAVNDVARELGAAIGIAVVGSTFNMAYRARVGELLGSAGEPLRETVRSSPAAGLAAAGEAGKAGPGVAETVRHGVISGWSATWVLVAVLCLAGGAFVAARSPANGQARVKRYSTAEATSR
jgi:predicted MFS family arabinose efflux permease